MGRPKLDDKDARSARVLIRAQPGEVARWKRAASKAGQSLSAWLRALANTATEGRRK